MGCRNLSHQTKMGCGILSGVRLSPECSVSNWFITEVRCKLRMPETSFVKRLKVHGGWGRAT